MGFPPDTLAQTTVRACVSAPMKAQTGAVAKRRAHPAPRAAGQYLLFLTRRLLVLVAAGVTREAWVSVDQMSHQE